MSICISQNVDLRRGDRIYISWEATGIPDGATVFISLEGGPWLPIDIGVNEIIGYFAGPDHVAPGAARVITMTTYVQFQVRTAPTTETFEGGFIRLVP